MWHARKKQRKAKGKTVKNNKEIKRNKETNEKPIETREKQRITNLCSCVAQKMKQTISVE